MARTTEHPLPDGSVAVVTHVTDEEMLEAGMVPSGRLVDVGDGKTFVKEYQPIS